MDTYSTRYRISFNFAIAFSALMIIGFIILGCFALPYADDFGYASGSSHGLFHYIHSYYLNWGGRYTAAFFTGLLATHLNYHYWAVPIIMIVGTLCAFFLLYQAIFQKWKEAIALAILSLGFYLIVTPWVHHGGPRDALRVYYEQFFWIGGGATYQFGTIFFVALLATIASYHRIKKGWQPLL